MTWIESSGAGKACLVVEVPGSARTVTWSRSFDGRTPAAAAAVCDRGLARDEGLDEPELRRRGGDGGGGVWRQRLAEVDLRRRLVDLPVREREEKADQRAEHSPDDEQPPARSDRPGVAPEVDFLLGLQLDCLRL